MLPSGCGLLCSATVEPKALRNDRHDDREETAPRTRSAKARDVVLGLTITVLGTSRNLMITNRLIELSHKCSK
jgi:hypothetical protein